MTIEELLLEWFGPEEIQKSFNPIEKAFVIEKAWEGENGDLNIEGWISTNDPDLEKDITEPEAFQKALDDYFALCAPISYNHNTKTLPAGHLQKGALVRDGQIFYTSTHPSDPADFEHFPNTGTGFYGKGVLTEPDPANAVRKKNARGFSFIGNATRYERLPGGGRRFREIYPLIETTVAPYPINRKAAIVAAKAYGLEEEEKPPMTPEEFAQMLAKAINPTPAPAPEPEPAPVQKALTLEDVQNLLVTSLGEFAKQVDEKITKAVTFNREGTGRAGTIVEKGQEDPIAYLVQKAGKSHDELTDAEKNLVGSLTHKLLVEGMSYGDE